MKIICLFAQRKCRYEGEYAPELLAAIDEYGNDDNPEYIDEQYQKANKDSSLAFTKRIIFSVPDKDFNRVFFGEPPTLCANIEEVQDEGDV